MELHTLVGAFNIVVPLLYGGLSLVYGLSFFAGAQKSARFLGTLLYGVLAFHIVYILLRIAAFDHPPITNVFEIMTLLAACITAAYAYVELRTGTRTTGFFILVLPFLFQTVSSLFIRDRLEIPDYLHSHVLGFHVFSAILGYTAISLSAVYGFLYLILYREIKSGRFGVIYNRLPNLEMLETMSHKAEVLGFVCLGIAIVIGLVWLPLVFKTYSYLDPKLVGTISIWLLYAVGLAAKRRLGWQGRKMMILSLVAFCIVFLSMTVINLSLSSFHSFH